MKPSVFLGTLKRILITVAIVFLTLYAAASFVRSVTRALSPVDPYASIDFHSYWYSGHFVIQGIDPYEAFFQKREPSIPVYYLDGYIDFSYPVGQPELARVPANTAPIVLFSTLFSFFSWPTAKMLWLIVNIVLLLAITCGTIFLCPCSAATRIDWRTALIFLSFWSWLATRNVIINGQTSGLIFALMLLSVATVDKSWIFSGIVLGLALSKYSLSIPIVLFFLLKKKYKVIVVSFLTQIASLIALAFITNASPLQVLDGYLRILSMHWDDTGIHITSALQVSNLALPSLIILMIFTSATVIPTVFWMYRFHPHLSSQDQQIGEFHTLVILMTWVLLVAYHREYDAIIMISFTTLLVYGISNDIWRLPNKMKFIISCFVGIFMIYLMRPETIIVENLIQAEDTIGARRPFWLITTILLILCLFLVIVLQYRIRPSTQFLNQNRH